VGSSRVLSLVLAIACATPEIVERPIPFGAERITLTVDYRRLHEDPGASSAKIAPKLIVLHHTAVGSLEASFATLAAVRLPATRPELAKGGAVNVSAHFLVDRDGTIYRLMPEDIMARHAIGLNHLAIGVENVGGNTGQPLTDAQVAANVWLVRDLVRRFPGITHVIGHHEARAMAKHPYFRERMSGYSTVKIDPGEKFMSRVRAAIADLGLQGPK